MNPLKIAVYADGANKEHMLKRYRDKSVQGFTTNPTLMRKAGVSDYETFARKVLAAITDRPVSFEVFADDFANMAEQAREIATWGPNVNVKIPITNTKGEPASELIRTLSSEGGEQDLSNNFPVPILQVLTSAQSNSAPQFVPPGAAHLQFLLI